MPDVIIADVSNDTIIVETETLNQNIVEVSDLVVIYLGMENGDLNLTPGWFDNHYRVQVTVQGVIDGANTDFTLPDSDAIISTVKLNYGGILIRGTDFSIDNAGSITMLFIPSDTNVPFLAEYYYGS